MFWNLVKIFFIILAFIFMQTSVLAEDATDCNIDGVAGTCSEDAECHLDTGEIGVCKSDPSGCICVPVS